MKVVAEGIDNDDIETAQKEAAAIMSANPNLIGWVACDAAGPIGIGIAIKEANKVGTVKEVGLDDLNQLIELIKEGVVDSSSASRPQMQGYWSIIALWQQGLGCADSGQDRYGREIYHAGDGEGLYRTLRSGPRAMVA